ncbi:MAG TPA: hypothetical protein VFL98_03755 [Candidatus Paceibacterota bacterium]|nr:hypothetical protein [Candidatus Paceibacterota bacterium]
MQRTRTTRLWIFAAISLAALAASWAAFGWMVLSVGGLRAQLATTTDERDLARAKAAYAQTLKEILSDTASDRAQLSELADASAVSIVSLIRGAATDAGADASITSIAPGTLTVGGRSVETLTVDLTAQGSFAEDYRLLTLLEALPVPLAIDSVSLDQRGATKGAPWTMTVELAVYTETADATGQ